MKLASELVDREVELARKALVARDSLAAADHFLRHLMMGGTSPEAKAWLLARDGVDVTASSWTKPL